jgi:predicted flavoprotein YhiN
MDLSEPFARGQAKDLQLDLLPEVSWEALREGLLLGGQRPGSPRLASLVKLSRRVLETVADLAELGESNPKLNQINKKQRQRLVETLKALRVPINGTLGFTKAEVTAGGLALNQVDRKTMQVHGHPGLYVFGELLDLTGPIGGFNFQAAWSTAQLAAESVAKGLGK